MLKISNRICLLYATTFPSFIQFCAAKSCPLKSSFRRMASLQPKKVIAICQMTAKSDKKSNISTCLEMIKAAKVQNAEMVFLPESCDFIGEKRSQFVENAEHLNGETVHSFCQMAKGYKVWLSLGGILEKADNEKIRNSHVVINSEGDVVSVYHKVHMFDVDIPEKSTRIMESDYVIPGERIVPPVETPVGKVGLAIVSFNRGLIMCVSPNYHSDPFFVFQVLSMYGIDCYDMRFPELSLTLAKMGADILTFPSAFTFATGAAHWETLLRARAIESQCYVVAAAQTGTHNSKRSSWGHAMVVDPWGTVIAQCSEGTGVAIAHIDTSYIQQVRSSMPVWQHRRNDLYAEMSPLKTAIKSEEIDNNTTYRFGSATVHGSTVFYKTNKSLAFTNKKCAVPGHVLVMPIRCVNTLKDLENDEKEDLFMVLKKVHEVVRNVNGASYVTTGIQTGAAAGQTVKHLHVHVLPRKSKVKGLEGGKFDVSHDRPERTLDEMSEEASMLRPYFNQ